MVIFNRIKEFIKKLIPGFCLSLYHYFLALGGAFLYGFPSRKIKVIGVTGTGGKSTTVEIIGKILEEGGFKTASISSIKFKIGEKEEENKLKMTMPGRFKIQRFIRKAVKAGCKYLVLEVTSEGIKQHRHKFIKFETAVFTNLSPEHIESHGGFENYRKAKLKLFLATKKTHIINADDENAEYFLKPPAQKKILFGIKKGDIRAQDIKEKDGKIYFKVKEQNFVLNLLGRFNVYNALAGICVGLSEGISLKTSKRALEKIEGVPGRMEIVLRNPFLVIVDYAFTPVALENVYKTVQESLDTNTKKERKMVCVLGACGGGRDKWKRPVLGEIAAKYCQEIIITNEDPYDEDPMEIIEQVAKGAGEKARKILDRREAIKKALELAQPSDAVVITGKGSEPWMCVAGGKKILWDDRKVVREEFQKIKTKIKDL